MTPRTRRAAAVGGMLLAGIAAGLLYPTIHPGTSGRLLRELARQSGAGVAGTRVSLSRGFHACTEQAPWAACGPPPAGATAHLAKLLREAERRARDRADAETLHALGLAYLLYADSAGNSLAKSITFLQSAARLADRPAPVLADLAAAHLARAARAPGGSALYVALETAQQALDLEPGNGPARFNAAVALDQAGLVLQAREEWTRYLAADSASAWAAEARRRLRALSPAPRPAGPGRNASAAALAAYAAHAPLQARELGSEQLLPEWAAAVLAGDTAVARARLGQAEALGNALESSGADASLAADVRAVRTHGADGGRTRRLATLHRAFGVGRAAVRTREYGPGAAALRTVADDPAAPPALREWSRLFLGICAVYETGVADPVALLEGVVAHADTARFPALAARARWALATALQRRGRPQESIETLRSAASLFRRAGEAEYQYAVAMAMGDARAALGSSTAAYESLHHAADALRAHPGTRTRYSVLFVLGPVLVADGLHRAALRVQDEAVGAADQTGEPDLAAEGRLLRARLRLRAGHADVAGDVEAARRLIPTVTAGFARGWLENDLRETRAMQALPTHPARADSLLRAVGEFFASNKVPQRLIPALFARAEAGLALGRLAEAERDLDRTVALLDSLRASTPSADLRASLLEASRRVFDRGVMMHLAAGRPDRALDYAERSRASFSPAGHARDWSRRPLRVPAGQAALALALIGDTLLAWTVSDGEIAVTRSRVSRAALLREVEQLRASLELRAGESTTRPALGRLYDRLVRPVRARLGPPGTTIVVVADGELAALPLEALWDGERYLVKDHPLRHVSTLRDAVAPPAGPATGTPPLVVAEPAFDGGSFPGLAPLQGVGEEVAALVGLYPRARVIAGGDARAKAVRDALPRGGMAHFAGHALFDDARPERSFLVLAPGGPGEPDRLTAGEIQEMQLRGLRLVVLSACETSRGQGGRSGGFAGLAGAFLAAGAGGVVGSVWRVDDGHTRTLMEAFHHAYRANGDGAVALRQAQLQMIESGDPARRAPSAWAGFRYAGG